MSNRVVARVARALVVCSVLASVSAVGARARALTFDEALALARARSAEVLRARQRIADARGALAEAEAPLHANPVLEAQGGPRFTVDETVIPQVFVGISQSFELADAQGARRDAARASLEEADALVEGAERQAQGAVAATFIAALAARAAREHTEGARSLAEAVLEVALARARAGDASAIDVHRASIATSQARADEHAARGAEQLALGELRALLGLAPEALALEGSLSDVTARPLAAVETAARPELVALRAAIRAAAAERRVGDARAIPELSVGLGYQYEEGDHMGLVSLSLSLPFFDHGQGMRARADGRRDALERELELRERAIAIELGALREALAATSAAAEESARSIASAAELAEMVRRSWEAGEISLGEVLVIRAELAAAARAHIARQREGALARAALDAALGVSP